MARIIISDPADADTAAIIDDLFQNALARVAMRYSIAFDDVYKRLEVFPQSAPRRISLGKRARICTVWPYVIIYDYLETNDVVAVLRVLHGRRKISRRLLQR